MLCGNLLKVITVWISTLNRILTHTHLLTMFRRKSNKSFHTTTATSTHRLATSLSSSSAQPISTASASVEHFAFTNFCWIYVEIVFCASMKWSIYDYYRYDSFIHPVFDFHLKATLKLPQKIISFVIFSLYLLNFLFLLDACVCVCARKCICIYLFYNKTKCVQTFNERQVLKRMGGKAL